MMEKSPLVFIDIADVLRLLRDEIKPLRRKLFLSPSEKKLYKWGFRQGYQAGSYQLKKTERG